MVSDTHTHTHAHTHTQTHINANHGDIVKTIDAFLYDIYPLQNLT